MVENETPEKAEPVQAQPKLTFRQILIQEGWPLADDFGKIVVIEREEKEILSLGFSGYSDNKKIVLSSEIAKWERVSQDILLIIKRIREKAKDEKKPKT